MGCKNIESLGTIPSFGGGVFFEPRQSPIDEKKLEEDLVKVYEFLFNGANFQPFNLEVSAEMDYALDVVIFEYEAIIISQTLGKITSSIKCTRLIPEFEELFKLNQ